MRNFVSKIKTPGEDYYILKTDAGLIVVKKNCIESWEDNFHENKKEYAVQIRLASGRILYISQEEFIRIWGLKKEEKV